MAKFLYINYNENSVVTMSSGELTPIYEAVIPVLTPIVEDADFFDKADIEYWTEGAVSLDELSSEHLMIAYDLIMSIDSLHPMLKEEIKQAFESDPRFKRALIGSEITGVLQ